MSSIDQRIVEMKFNNAAFTKGVDGTLKSLEGLKKGMALDGAKNGLDGLSSAVKGFSFGSISSGIEAVQAKFSNLAVIGITALSNITSKAVDAGLQMAKSLTIDPIKAGFDEYELKMGSIQTILSNTARHGTGLDEVTASLDSLNEYADKTIYNFGDMTKNIGLFTNAGIGVEDATSMIKGFSNEAAASGTNSQGAASAAYQLSQALSAGTIRLMDWRSLQNVGMGNKNMQNGLIEIAEAMGQFNGDTTSATAATDDFNGSLESNWLSADVMSSYLKIMAGDMTAAEQASLGLSDAQIQAFTDQQGMAEDAATKVRTYTQLVDTMREGVGSSWSETFDLLVGDFNQATEMWTAVSDKLGGIISSTGDARNNLLRGFVEAGGRELAIDSIKNAFTALETVMKPIKEAFQEIFPPATADTLIKIATAIRDFTAGLVISDSAAAKVKSTFKGFFAALDIGWMVIKGLAGVLKDFFTSATEGSSGILDFTAKVGDWIVGVRDALKNGEDLSKFFDGLSAVIQKPIELLRQFGSWVSEAFSSLGKSDGEDGGFAAIGRTAEDLKSKLEPLGNIGENIANTWAKVVAWFEKVKAVFAPMAEFLKEKFGGFTEGFGKAFQDIDWGTVLGFINTGLFAGLVSLIKKFFSDFEMPGGGLLDSIKDAFGGMTDTLGAMQNTLRAATLLQIAIAIGVLAASALVLSTIDADGLKRSLGAMTVMFLQLAGALAVLDKIGFAKGLPSTALGLILLAIAVNILASAVKKLAELSWEELGKGLSAVTVLLGILTGAVKLMSSNTSGMFTAGLGMIAIAIAIKILASAVEDFSEMSWEEMGKGLTGVAVTLGALALFTKLAEANKGGLAQSVGLILLAVAIKMLAGAVAEFATNSWEDLGKGLGSIVAILAAVAGFTQLSGGAAKSLASAAALLIIAYAMDALGKVIRDLADMSWEELAKGLVGMAGALLIIAGAMQLMPTTMIVSAVALVIVAKAITELAAALKSMGGMTWEEIAKGLVTLAGALAIIAGAMYLMVGALPGAAALLVVSAALTMLTPVLIALGNMSWAQIGMGMAALAAAFIVLGLGTLALTPVLPSLLLLGVAIGLLGVGVALAGVGIMAMGIGLTALAAAGAAAIPVVISLITSLIELIPQIAIKLAEGVMAFIQTIVENTPALVEAAVALIRSLLDAINTVGPEIIETVFNLVMALVDELVIAVPKFVDAAVKIVAGIVQGIADNIQDVVDAAADLIVNFIQGITDNLPDIVQAGVDLITEFLDAIADAGPDIVESAADAIIEFVNGIATAIENKSTELGEAGGNLAVAIVDGMVNGLGGGISKIRDKATEVAKSALNAAKSFLGIASPSKEFKKVGAWSVQGLAKGLESTAPVQKAGAKLGSTALSSVGKAMGDLEGKLDSKIDLKPTITPVVDWSDVEKNPAPLMSTANSNPFKVNAELQATPQQGLVGKVSELMSTETRGQAGAGGSNSMMGQTMVFTQNIQSTRPIPTIELYRHTKNLISASGGGRRTP